MNKTMFECDGFNGIFEGYTNGTYWNGWACPWFTKEVATQIMTANNSIEDAFRMEYDSTTDTFTVYIVEHETGKQQYAFAEDFNETTVEPSEIIRATKRNWREKEEYEMLRLEQQGGII